MKLRLITWNIAGAHKIHSSKFMDYDKQDVEYFSEQIRKLNPDVVCLQESQTRTEDSLTERLSAATGLRHWIETDGCPSHIDRQYRLTSAILSKLPFKRANSTLLPKPDFELRFTHDDRVVQPYERYVIKADFEGYSIATTHIEPLGSFGLDYGAGKGKTLARAIDDTFQEELTQPLLFAGDFNTENLGKSFPNTLKANELVEVFDAEPTRPDGGHTDHITYSPQWQLCDSGIVHAESDHYLCWADFATNPY